MDEFDTHRRLLAFLAELEERRIWYRLMHNRHEAIAVLIATPGHYWEVEFLEDGSVEVERFRSKGTLQGEEAIAEILDQE